MLKFATMSNVVMVSSQALYKRVLRPCIGY